MKSIFHQAFWKTHWVEESLGSMFSQYIFGHETNFTPTTRCYSAMFSAQCFVTERDRCQAEHPRHPHTGPCPASGSQSRNPERCQWWMMPQCVTSVRQSCFLPYRPKYSTGRISVSEKLQYPHHYSCFEYVEFAQRTPSGPFAFIFTIINQELWELFMFQAQGDIQKIKRFFLP